MFVERRKSERRRLLRRGRIVYRQGHSVIECVMMNISEAGAALKAPMTFGVPTTFELRVENGQRYDVEIAHRSFDTMGVRFVGSDPT